MMKRLLALLALSAAMLPGVSAQDVTPVPGAELAGSTWQLISLNTPDGEALLEQGEAITLEFGPDNAFSGYSGCNTYMGSASVMDDGVITLGPIGSTKMACANDTVAAQEMTYLTALESAGQYRLAGDRLILLTEDGHQLTFVASGAYALLNSQWQLAAMHVDGEPVELAADTAITLEFTSDKDVAGRGGCNQYGGMYQADDQSIDFSQILSTLMACADSGVMDQEQQYFKMLDLVTGYEIADGQLTLSAADGEQQMIFVPAGAYALRLTRWQLTSATVGGEDVVLVTDTPITLEFFTPENVGGSAGCNNFGAIYAIEGDTLTIGQLASTLMACETSEVMDQEAWFLEMLAQAERFAISAGDLILYTPDGMLQFTPVSDPLVSGAA